MSSALHRLGSACARHGWRVLALWAAVLVGLGVFAATAGPTFTDSMRVPGAESQRANDLLADRFPTVSGGTATVVFRAGSGTLTDPANADTVVDVLDRIAAVDHVVAVSDPLGTAAGPPALSPDERTAYAGVRFDRPAADLDRGLLDDLTAAADTGSEQVRAVVGGELPFVFQSPESSGAEAVGVLVALLVLSVAFGSLVAAGLPLLMALLGLGVGITTVALLSRVVGMAADGPTIAVMIGLGVGIDYALFVLTRYRDIRAGGVPVPEAVGRASATAGQAVVFAGGTVVVAILGLYLTGITSVGSMGLAAAVVVLSSVLAAVTALPAVLGLLGDRVERVRVLPRRRGPADGWIRWSRHVARHPWSYATGATAALLLTAVPFLDLRLGMPDASAAADDSGLREAYELLADGFGPGVNGPLTVVAAAPAGAPLDPATVTDVAGALRDAPGVAEVLPPVLNSAGDTAVITAVPDSAPQDAATTDLLDRLRGQVLPAIDVDGELLVTGPTAAFIDLADLLADRLPVFIATVVGLSLVLLLVLFRSIWVPVKAAVVNLLSIGAAYGVVVAVFQWGWGLELLGIAEPLPIVSFMPMFMFAVLFGLSMDYEVFLLSRVREEYLRTGDPDEAVTRGLAATARVISSAALIMVSVFLAFVASPQPLLKMLGLGLATAILVDATVVRLLLVPAVMKLLGHRAWWLPGRLDRTLPQVDLEQVDPEQVDLDERPGHHQHADDRRSTPELPIGSR